MIARVGDRGMRVTIVGAGLMGAQIGCEYALGGHKVKLVARNAAAALERAEAALRLLGELGLMAPAEADAARERITVDDLESAADCDLAVESVPEDLALKVELLEVVASASPAATLATNTSSLSVSELGRRLNAPGRTIGTHYWNPPLLMPLVEVVPGESTAPAVVDRVERTLRALGKRPVRSADVPGFVWNRLQMALLREAMWIVENGVASAETVEEILTHGLGRRWRRVPFFTAIALGGVGTWQQASSNLLPEVSAATEIGDLARWTPTDDELLAAATARRDRGLAADLLEDRGATAAPEPDGGG